MKVTLQNLTKIFPSRDKKSGKEVVAVNDFTFEIPDGKLIGLLGPSGCGKSTTFWRNWIPVSTARSSVPRAS